MLFPPQWQLFDRRLEKIVSISASLASATFTQAGGEPVQFLSNEAACARWHSLNQG